MFLTEFGALFNSSSEVDEINNIVNLADKCIL